MPSNARYHCINVPDAPGLSAPAAWWRKIQQVPLVDVVTGGAPALETFFQIYRDDKQGCLYARFFGRDDSIRSDFRLRDEPLWQQDVVEMFIAHGDDLTTYRELQASPWDVLLDGIITRAGDGSRKLDLGWDATGFISQSVFDRKKGVFSCTWKLPYGAFAPPPQQGESWRFNVFRVDWQPGGLALQAWQSTGERNFHVPQRFGYLEFDG